MAVEALSRFVAAVAMRSTSVKRISGVMAPGAARAIKETAERKALAAMLRAMVVKRWI